MEASGHLERARARASRAQWLADNRGVPAGDSYQDLLTAAGVDALLEIAQQLRTLNGHLRDVTYHMGER